MKLEKLLDEEAAFDQDHHSSATDTPLREDAFLIPPAEKVALIEDSGDVALTVYDTSANYILGDSVYSNDAGIITSVGVSNPIGIITKPPTADDVSLHVKLTVF